MLKCAPIKNQNDQIEVAGYLAAGDPENKPSQLLSMPLTIPQHERAQTRGRQFLLFHILELVDYLKFDEGFLWNYRLKLFSST